MTAFSRRTTALVVCLGLAAGCASMKPAGRARATGTTYYVDGTATNAADANPGTASRPWKTLARAGQAKELKPGDTVLIRSGVYRESVRISVSGDPGRPIVFAAEPGARVILKGSELITAPWARVTPDRGVPEPYPNAFQNVWKVKLGEAFFTDPNDPGAFADKSRRKVTQVILGDTEPLFPVGPDSKIATGNGTWVVVEPVGKGLEDLRTGTFFFDPKEQELYTKVGGEPGWYSVEVSVRNGVLRVEGVHDVIIRGLEVRHSRGNLAGVSNCQRVTLEDCQFTLADFCNLGMGNCTECVVRRCDLSWGGNSGMNMGDTLDCVIEDCTIMFNNYRRYGAGWHDGGMKNIPGNKRTTIRRCEVAYNYSGGVWFDMLNVDTRILDNVLHHNVGDGVGFEVNYGPGVIAGNLCYANGGYGIGIVGHPDLELMRKVFRGEAGDANERRYVPERLKDWLSFPSERLWIVHNTLADNANGIGTSHSEGSTEFGQTRILRNVTVMNNLFLHNGQPFDPEGKYVDLRFWMHLDQAGRRADTSCHSDYNVFAAGAKPMLKPHYWYPAWGKERTLAEWQKLYDEDRHSQIVPVRYRCSRAGFELQTAAGLDGGGPLPDEVTRIWKPGEAHRVGAAMTAWPASRAAAR
jgi:hypothetical protein